MDFRAWAASLLNDNPDLAYEVNVFIEKRWRDGRTPQPRGKGGRWVKHTPNLHVGLGISGGSGHGSNFFAEKLRPDDNEHVGPKRLPWKKNPNGDFTARMKGADDSYSIHKDVSEDPPRYIVRHHSDAKTVTGLGSYPTMLDARRAASTHVNDVADDTPDETAAPAVKPLNFVDGEYNTSEAEIPGEPGKKYILKRETWGLGRWALVRKDGPSYYHEKKIGRFDNKEQAIAAANENHAAKVNGTTPDKYLDFIAGGSAYKAQSGDSTYRITENAAGKYVLSGRKDTTTGIRKIGEFDSLKEAKDHAHELFNGRGEKPATPLEQAKALPAGPTVADGKPLTWKKHPSGAYVGANGYSMVRDGSKWRVFKRDGDEVKEISGAPTLAAGKAQAQSHREFGSPSAAEVAAKKKKAAERAAAHKALSDAVIGNNARIAELDNKLSKSDAENAELEKLRAWQNSQNDLVVKAKNKQPLTDQEKLALDAYLPHSIPDLDSIMDMLGNGNTNDARSAVQQLFSGEMGRGMGARMHSISRFSPNEFRISGYITGPDGSVVGSITRTFTKTGDEWGVYHNFMKIEKKSLQGRGFASVANQRLFDYYKRNGIKSVTVSAALANGGYTWATQGFKWDRQYANPYGNVKSHIQYLLSHGRNSYNNNPVSLTEGEKDKLRALLAQFQAGNPPEPYDIARMEGEEPEFGRRILAGSHWQGRRPI